MTWKKISFYDSGLPFPTDMGTWSAVSLNTALNFFNNDLPTITGWSCRASSFGANYVVIETPPVTHDQTGENVFFSWHMYAADNYQGRHHLRWYPNTTRDGESVDGTYDWDYVSWAVGNCQGYTVWLDDAGSGLLVLSDTGFVMFYWPSFAGWCGDWNPLDGGNDLTYCDKISPHMSGYQMHYYKGNPIGSLDFTYLFSPMERVRKSYTTSMIDSADQDVYLYSNFYLQTTLSETVARFAPSQLMLDYPATDYSLTMFGNTSLNTGILAGTRYGKYKYNGKYYVQISGVWLDMGEVEPDFTLTSNGIV